MVLEKKGRNRLFIKAWKEESLGNEALADRFNMTVGSVKSLKSRLRKRYPDLYYSRMSVKPSRRGHKSMHPHSS